MTGDNVVAGLAATFAVGTLWFWLLIAAEIGLLLLFENFKQGFAATLSVLAFIAFLQFGAKVNIFAYVVEHWYAIIPIAIAYLIGGALWSIYKWRRLIIDRLELYKEKFAEYLQDNGLPEGTEILPESHREKWIKIVDSTRNYSVYANKYETIADTPQVKYHKADIIRWQSMWVFSVILYACKDLVSDIFKGIYRRIAAFLQKMADDMWPKNNIAANLQKPESNSPSNDSRRN